MRISQSLTLRSRYLPGTGAGWASGAGPVAWAAATPTMHTAHAKAMARPERMLAVATLYPIRQPAASAGRSLERGVAKETSRRLQGRRAAKLAMRGQQFVQPRIPDHHAALSSGQNGAALRVRQLGLLRLAGEWAGHGPADCSHCSKRRKSGHQLPPKTGVVGRHPRRRVPRRGWRGSVACGRGGRQALLLVQANLQAAEKG